MKKKLIMLLLSLALTLAMAAPALAASEFRDVDTSSPWYAGITYAAQRGITAGTGNNCFSPDQQVTLRQWAVLVCRAYGKETPEGTGDAFGQACVELGRSEGWLDPNLSADSPICRGAALESIFQAAGLTVYDYDWYDGGYEISDQENHIRVAAATGLCDDSAAAADFITRGEAVQILYLVLTGHVRIEEPEFIAKLGIENTDGAALDDYLEQASKVPDSIMDQFARHGWSYRLDSAYLDDLGKRLDMRCVGATSYRNAAIYVREAYATIHEFGHFYHYVIGFPEEIEELYAKEGKAAEQVLGRYAVSNYKEYFAESFTYWINHHMDAEKLALFQQAAPETYQYIAGLAAGNWTV